MIHFFIYLVKKLWRSYFCLRIVNKSRLNYIWFVYIIFPYFIIIFVIQILSLRNKIRKWILRLIITWSSMRKMVNQVYFLFIVLIWFCSNKFVHGNNDCLMEGKTWSTEGTVYISGQYSLTFTLTFTDRNILDNSN